MDLEQTVRLYAESFAASMGVPARARSAERTGPDTWAVELVDATFPNRTYRMLVTISDELHASLVEQKEEKDGTDSD